MVGSSMRKAELPEASIPGVYVSVPELMALEHKAAGLTFLPRRTSRSVLSGRHTSRMRGRGLNFEEIRDYLPGDDIRNLDWKVTLRLGKPHVRTYTEERDRPALFVIDQRMPMFFGSRLALKSVAAAQVAALGAWMVLHAGDRVGAMVFNDHEIRHIRPHRSRSRVEALCRAVADMNRALAAGSPVHAEYSQLDRALERALQAAHHDHFVCIVSDFAGMSERTDQLLRELRVHNDLVAVLVFDPLARSAVGDGQLVVTEGTLQVEVNLNERQVREPLESFFAGRLQYVAAMLRRSDVPLLAIDSGEPVIEQIRRLLGRRVPLVK